MYMYACSQSNRQIGSFRTGSLLSAKPFPSYPLIVPELNDHVFSEVA